MPFESSTNPFPQDWERCFDRKPISANPILADLDIEHNELAQTCKSFVRRLLLEDRVDMGEQPPSPADVLALVRQLQTGWVSRPRRRQFANTITLAGRFLPTVQTHAALMAVLPDSDLFHAPLFYSVLQIVLKASSNYPHVIECLLTALLDIHRALDLPEEPLSSAHLLPVAQIYALIFFFLTEFMDWYVRRSTCALLNCHSQDAYAEFYYLVRCIQRQARALAGPADAMDLDLDLDTKCDSAYSPRALWEESQLSQVGRQGAERRIAAQNTITRRLIWEIQQDAEERARIREQRDQLLAQMLTAVSEHLTPIAEQSSGIVCLTTAAPDLGMEPPTPLLYPCAIGEAATETNLPPVTTQFEWSRGSKRRLARLELQNASKHLQVFFDSDDQVADFAPDVRVAAEGTLITSLQNWMTNPRSHALAVGGPQNPLFPNSVALISACYASIARRTRLPVVAHFCALSTEGVLGLGLTPHQRGLIALTYSLIRQLIDSLPTVVDSDALLDLSAERFLQLDGSMYSWKAALALVDTLLHFVPPLLVCVIDGIDTIQDASTDVALRELIRVLLTHTRHQPQPMDLDSPGPTFLFKVLFTVAGRPSALVETMSENQVIMSESTAANESTPSDPVLTSDLGAVMMNA
ncbi:hypothetical protein N7462_009208 [Penicillium macrosclerotiorum]|uniref:uncharacterized protein n=1 Tax=Penicillium macrosclerotiorum TaxID=303699 RepID=UPI002548DB83|nr:uncharacterized protein N7462_009208 [Penicillium macrosclerotiorum]KAJ5673769.1 hypothetical protein N7462_009208 [Penicillium macrosclerotiorum]